MEHTPVQCGSEQSRPSINSCCQTAQLGGGEKMELEHWELQSISPHDDSLDEVRHKTWDGGMMIWKTQQWSSRPEDAVDASVRLLSQQRVYERKM